MKIESKAKGFRPVTITIETEDELRTLWHALTVPISKWSRLGEVNDPRIYVRTKMLGLLDEELKNQGLKND